MTVIITAWLLASCNVSASSGCHVIERYVQPMTLKECMAVKEQAANEINKIDLDTAQRFTCVPYKWDIE